MSLRVGPYTFNEVIYDGLSDVLYATIGALAKSRREPTPEQHVWHFDDRGQFRGITLMSPRERLERDGAVYVSLPTGELERVQGIEMEMRAPGVPLD
ncbi:MAG: hypothetical protein ACR2OC_07185 [Solirubrobacterales bacterium]